MTTTMENLLCINYYQLGEYKKIVQLLSELTHPLTGAELFLLHFAEFQQCLLWRHNNDALELSLARYSKFQRHLKEWNGELDAFLYLLLSLYENHLGHHSLAVRNASRAINECPLLFGAWVELGYALSRHLGDSREECSLLCSSFLAKLREQHGQLASLLVSYLSGQWRITLTECQSLEIQSESLLGGAASHFALLQKAMHLNNNGEHVEARIMFEELHRTRPLQLDGMDCYSDILFLEGQEAHLAALCTKLGPVDQSGRNPVIYHVLGNYHSLRREFAEAAIFFHKAAQADPRRYSAWILAAQQYLELRQPEATVDCFLRATEGNPADFRGWFGLGQVYELLGITQMALLNYHRALQLAKDLRVMIAIADCLVHLGRLERALDYYEMAMSSVVKKDGEDRNQEARANLHLKLGFVKSKMSSNHDEAIEHFRIYLDGHAEIIHSASPIDDPLIRVAILFVAQDDQKRGDHLRASLLFSLLSRSHGSEALIARNSINSLDSTRMVF